MNCKSFYGSKKQQQWVTHRLRIPPTNLSEESDLSSDTDEEIFSSSTIESETDEEILKEPSDSDTNDDDSINTTSQASAPCNNGGHDKGNILYTTNDVLRQFIH